MPTKNARAAVRKVLSGCMYDPDPRECLRERIGVMREMTKEAVTYDDTEEMFDSMEKAAEDVVDLSTKMTLRELWNEVEDIRTSRGAHVFGLIVRLRGESE